MYVTIPNSVVHGQFGMSTVSDPCQKASEIINFSYSNSTESFPRLSS